MALEAPANLLDQESQPSRRHESAAVIFRQRGSSAPFSVRLRVVAWDEEVGDQSEQRWYYSDQRYDTANFSRRWVHFCGGRACIILNDYWSEF